MRKLIPAILVCVVVLSTSKSTGQVVYTDFNPDGVLQMPVESLGDFFIDVDGDNVDDARFFYTNYPSVNLWNLGVQQPDTNDKRFEVYYDNTINKSPIGDYYAKVFSSGDAIAASANYSSDYPQLGDIYNGNFNGQGTKYLGFRLKTGANSYKYGWMSIELSGSGSMTFTLKELAYNNTPNTPIKAGQNTIGVRSFGLQELKVKTYPNPVQNNFSIELAEPGENIASVKIYSPTGQLVRVWENLGPNAKLDLTEFEKGIYQVEIGTEEKISVIRLLKL